MNPLHLIKRLFNRARSAPTPTTLDEVVDQIVSTMTEDDKARYRLEDPEWPGVRFHFSGGMAMRNELHLWEHDHPLGQWFLSKGVWHGDDRSACVFKALYCRLTGTPFDIAKEAAHYDAFWCKSYAPDSPPAIVRSEDGTWRLTE